MTPTIEKAARACCLTTCCATDCLNTGVCHAIDLGSEVKRAVAVLEATLKPSDEEVEAATVTLWKVSSATHWEDLHPVNKDTQREQMRAALRAARLASLGQLRNGDKT